MSRLGAMRESTRHSELIRRVGVVRDLSNGAIEADGPDAVLGEVCTIGTRGGAARVQAEVVGLRPGTVTLMPYGSSVGMAPGCDIVASGACADVGVGTALLGRVIDGFGNALDGRPDPQSSHRREVASRPSNPMLRPRIDKVLETGVRAIDTLLTLGQGQRVGIFAGSGVGKSTLLGQIAKHVRADVNVIALVGERGREVREFMDRQLGPAGLERSVLVVATSDQPALARIRAAYAAVTIAEHFRDQGQQVLLTMDSVTRLAMARREVGLAAGEPPTARGYTPSVFTELPQLCERCGTAPSGGAITALFTVLVEGDDLNEPIADCLRATLDGHIVLARELAHRGVYPAIDVLRSASRLMPEVATSDERALAGRVVKTLAILERNRQLVEIGAYVPGSNAELDRALAMEPALLDFLRQSRGASSRQDAFGRLAAMEAQA